MFVLYDSTFDGLLSATAFCLRRGLQPLGLQSELDQQPLLETISVPCEQNIRRLFRRHLGGVLGPAAAEAVLDTVFRAFLSEMDGMATRIWQYLARALELRQDPADRLYEPAVAAVVTAARRVSAQAHQYLGLLRFRQVGSGFYLADFEPDYHVLPLILPHFAYRLADQDFAIRDLRRKLAAVHQAGGATCLHILADSSCAPEPAPVLPSTGLLPAGIPAAGGLAARDGLVLLDQPDEDFARLWRLYLQRLSIPERRNPALQRANMPKKYWRYLTEDPAAADIKKQGGFPKESALPKQPAAGSDRSGKYV